MHNDKTKAEKSKDLMIAILRDKGIHALGRTGVNIEIQMKNVDIAVKLHGSKVTHYTKQCRAINVNLAEPGSLGALFAALESCNSIFSTIDNPVGFVSGRCGDCSRCPYSVRKSKYE